MQKPTDNKNLILATIISFAILLAWAWFYEKPRIEKREAQMQKELILQAKNKNLDSKTNSVENELLSSNEEDNLKKPQKTKVNNAQLTVNNNEVVDSQNFKTREDVLNQTQNLRVKINTQTLHGSISLKGARFDDLTFVDYFEKPYSSNVENKEVILFSPSESKSRYFADFGWISNNSKIDLPNPNSLWTANLRELSVGKELILSWKNNQSLEFIIKIAIDEQYMFTISQIVKNNSKYDISLASYGRINRILNNLGQSNYILHEGAIGSIQGVLQEKKYEDLIEEKEFIFADSSENGSWLGITDKFWLSAIIPDKSIAYSTKFSYDSKNKNNFFNVDFVGDELKILAGDEIKLQHHLFAGAKKVKLLDRYSHDLNLKLFDRAIDFGWFYFLTKPFFFIIDFLNKFLGNFGLAILAMTVLIKLALFPMANKSYEAIAKMRTLQPKIDDLRKRFKDDKLSLNREMMNLYKREKINPASGCLPVLIQIPVFFALYKVLFVTLDMRHAPFFGWIKDLSAPDPTTIFNLFGLLPFEVGASFHVGIWPILMGITMIVQQKLSPASSDPTQAKILKFMPYVLTFVLATFPAGLVIYWTWSNILSIIQQLYINKKYKK
jgi:YidC/Oxa1 family membrane protein insertase